MLNNYTLSYFEISSFFKIHFFILEVLDLQKKYKDALQT